MSQYVFGSGILWGKQLTDASGNAIANPTPVKFGALSDVSIDISFDTKMLYGQNQFPLAVGRGKGKVSGKAKAAQINGNLLNSIVFGQTLVTGLNADNMDISSGLAVPATPFTVTGATTVATATSFQIPNTGTYVADLGVTNYATGIPLTRVASAPAAGQYSVNETTGAYLFASADNVSGVKVLINYRYTSAVSGIGYKSTVVNLPMGYAPTFSASFSAPYNGKIMTLDLPMCISSKLTIATKLDDFTLPEFAWESFADASGNVFSYSLSE